MTLAFTRGAVCSDSLPDHLGHAADRWPHAIAVDVPPGVGRPHRTCLSYSELGRRSDVMRTALGPAAGEIVAVLLPRTTAALYIAQLAVLRAGAAFVCVDPGFPDSQVGHILADTAAVALLTDDAGAGRAARIGYAGRVIRVDRLPGTPACPPAAPPEADGLAYVVYTSGTTGLPKGVLIRHEGIANLIRSDLEEFGLGPGDRIAQGSSAAYDSSVEEIWMAFASGGTVVVLDEQTVRLGPDLVPWLRNERITVFCPPPTLLRAAACPDPERELPNLRLLYVGGEALPPDVADRWARGRRMVNGYGPTECTVTCLRADVLPGHEITIGVPVPGMTAWVLDENLRVVAPGVEGELCMSGPGVAAGYHNRADLSAEKFPEHPALGRLYRTGDLVRVQSDGSHLYSGRIDSQVKLRGYRVELEAVEACLVRCPGVREAACRVQGDGAGEALAAHVVATDPARPPDPAGLRARLRDMLPAYMVPVLIRGIAELPRSAGGKVRRVNLPVIAPAGRHRHPDSPAVADPVVAAVAAAVRDAFGLDGAPGIDDDFFDGLGGSSLQAAMVVSTLRAIRATASTTVRDVYEQRTVGGLAGRANAASGSATSSERPEPDPQPVHGAAGATAVQSAWLLVELAVGSAIAWAVLFTILPWLAGRFGLVPLMLAGPFALLVVGSLLSFVPIMIAVAAKRILIGRYTPVRVPAWSGLHVRFWLVAHLVRIVPWRFIAGTELQCMALRALGARIGRRVHIHRGVDLLQGGWDLLDIGDDVTLGQDAGVRLVQFDAGHIVVGPVTLGAGSTLDVRAGVGPHSHVGERSWLTALSALPGGMSIPAGERWDGVPARPVGPAPKPPAPTVRARELRPLPHGLVSIAAHTLLWTLVGLPTVAAWVGFVVYLGLDYDGLIGFVTHPFAHLPALTAAASLTCLGLVTGLGVEAVVARVLGRVREGVISRWSVGYIRVWMKAGLVDSAGRWLSGGLFWPVWLRWAGMRVGRRCEISTILDVVPELVEIGHDTFFADGIYLGGPRVQAGTVTLAGVQLGRDTFLGNHAVVPAGQRLPPDILLGICTVADQDTVRPGTSWFGHPTFELPRREIVAADREVTHEPSVIRVANRVLWEWLRFALPVVPLIVAVVWIAVTAAVAPLLPLTVLLAVAVPAVGLGCAGILCATALGLKWSLLGRVREGTHPLWSCWCSRWDFLYVAWGVIASGVLSALEGTQLLAVYLRLTGMRIGRRVLLGGGFAQVVDPDMLELDDGATVNAMFQAHTFEDRVLKIGQVRVGPGSTLAENTVPLYGADIGAGTHVAAHSVVMKHERLLPGIHYEGAPTRESSTEPVEASDRHARR